MLNIRQEQEDALEKAMAKQFVNELYGHMQGVFPSFCVSLEPSLCRQAILQASINARQYGFNQRGPIRLYVEATFLLGSNFDSDPQFSTFTMLLRDKTDAMLKAEQLLSALQAYEERVLGNGDANWRQAIKRLVQQSHQNITSGNNLQTICEQTLWQLFPEKARYIGQYALKELVQKSLITAREYHLNTPNAQLIFTRLSFLLGHHCAKDPLHPWLKEALLQSQQNPDECARHCQQIAIAKLTQILEMDGIGSTV